MLPTRPRSRPAERLLTRAVRAACLGLALASIQGHALAADPVPALDAAAPRAYNIAAGPLGRALASFGVDAGLALSFDPALTDGLTSNGLSGTHTAREAAALLLAGSNLELVARGDGTYTLRKRQAAVVIPGETALPPVRVTAKSDPNALPAAYAGGKVARGGRNGMMGDGDYMSSPVNVVAFTSEFRDDTQALSVSDMLKYSVSAQTPQAGAVNTTDVLYVRGFSVGSFDGTFEGLPGLLGRMPPVETVERVELLLGANTFANGTPGAVGGSINIVPKRAGDEPLYRVGVNARTESIFGTTVDMGRRFGPDNVLGLRVNLGYSDGDTELTNGQRRTFARSLAFDFRGDDTRFTFDYMGNDRRLPAEAWFAILPGGTVPDVKRASRDFRQPWTFYKDEWDAAVARGQWDFATGWTATAAIGRMWNKVERLSMVSEINDADGNLENAYQVWGGSVGHSKQNRYGHAHEVSVRGQFNLGSVKNVLNAGFSEFGERGNYAGVGPAAYFDYASNIYSPVHYPAPALTPPEMPTSAGPRTRNKSIFIANEFRMLEERLSVTLGARQVAFHPNDDSGTKKKLSPGVGIVFKAQPTLSVYANYLEGLDAGYTVEQNGPGGTYMETLPPLPAKQMEVGVKGDLGTLGYTAALFDIKRPSYYSVSGITANNGMQRNRGLELSLFGKPMPQLSMYGSTTFIDPTLEKTDGGTNDGKLPQSAARFLANVHADWSLPMVQGLGLLGAVSHSGKVYNDDSNTQLLKAWTRLDAGVRYRTKLFGRQTVTRLNLDNVLDKKYWVSERGTIYMAPARTIGVSFTADL
ncbi:MAG: TonB-dependent receptor [Rhizobacter sp.]